MKATAGLALGLLGAVLGLSMGVGVLGGFRRAEAPPPHAPSAVQPPAGGNFALQADPLPVTAAPPAATAPAPAAPAAAAAPIPRRTAATTPTTAGDDDGADHSGSGRSGSGRSGSGRSGSDDSGSGSGSGSGRSGSG